MKKFVFEGKLVCIANEREIIRDSMVLSCGVCKREIKLKKVSEGDYGKDKRIDYKRKDGAKISGKTWNISYMGYTGTVYESYFVCGNCARYRAFNEKLTFGQAVETGLKCAEVYNKRKSNKLVAKVKEEKLEKARESKEKLGASGWRIGQYNEFCGKYIGECNGLDCFEDSNGVYTVEYDDEGNIVNRFYNIGINAEKVYRQAHMRLIEKFYRFRQNLRENIKNRLFNGRGTR